MVQWRHRGWGRIPATTGLTWHHVVRGVHLSCRVGHGQVPALFPLLPVTVTEGHSYHSHQ